MSVPVGRGGRRRARRRADERGGRARGRVPARVARRRGLERAFLEPFARPGDAHPAPKGPAPRREPTGRARSAAGRLRLDPGGDRAGSPPVRFPARPRVPPPRPAGLSRRAVSRLAGPSTAPCRRPPKGAGAARHGTGRPGARPRESPPARPAGRAASFLVGDPPGFPRERATDRRTASLWRVRRQSAARRARA